MSFAAAMPAANAILAGKFTAAVRGLHARREDIELLARQVWSRASWLNWSRTN
jgi:hypothetical protein